MPMGNVARHNFKKEKEPEEEEENKPGSKSWGVYSYRKQLHTDRMFVS